MLASLPLFLVLGVHRSFDVILFLAGVIIYFDGLVQNRKWEKGKETSHNRRIHKEITWASNAQGEREGQMPCRFQDEYRTIRLISESRLSPSGN